MSEYYYCYECEKSFFADGPTSCPHCNAINSFIHQPAPPSSDCKTSEEWFNQLERPRGTVIMDADGWCRDNFKYSWSEERISKEEFYRRLTNSTLQLDLFHYMEEDNEHDKGNDAGTKGNTV